MRAWIFTAVFLCSGCLFGQGKPPAEVVALRASKEFACPEANVRVEELGGTSYRVDACGKQATYTCLGGNVGNPYDAACTKEAATK